MLKCLALFIRYIIKQFDKRAGRKVNYMLSLPEEVREKIRAEYVKGSKEFGRNALAKKYGVSTDTIYRIVSVETVGYKSRGNTPRVPDELREQICAEFISGDSQFGTKALAVKYGVSPSTILNIRREGNITPKTPLIPADIQEKIRAEYINRSKEFGSVALAKKYGCSYQTILRIVHGR